MSDSQTSLNHEGRITKLETQLETLIEDVKEIKSDVKELGNGKFKGIIIETNQKLMEEILNRNYKEKEFELEKDKSKWKYIVEKNKIVFTFLGGAAGIKLIELASELIKKLIN